MCSEIVKKFFKYLFIDLHFDEPDAIDVVPAKKIAMGDDPDNLEEGSIALFQFDGDGKAYQALIVAKGMSYH